VGHGQPDEPDRPGDRHRPAGAAHDAHRGEAPGEGHPLAERPRDVLAEGQRVERAPGQEGEHHPDHQERRRPRQHLQVATGERADHPEPEGVQGAGVEQRHRRGQRGEQGGHRRPRQRQGHRARRRPARRPEGVDDHRRHRRPEQGEPRVPGHARDAQDVDRRHHGERRAGLDAEDAGIGERVARHALDHGARDAQRRADRDPDERPRQPELPDGDVGVGAREVGERGDHLGQRDRKCAHRQRQQGREDQQSDPDQQARRARRPAGERGRPSLVGPLVGRGGGRRRDAHSR
jgi:hypothetical protein